MTSEHEIARHRLRNAREQREWFAAHGGNVEAYRKRYNRYFPDGTDYGNGGDAIFVADQAALVEAEALEVHAWRFIHDNEQRSHPDRRVPGSDRREPSEREARQ